MHPETAVDGVDAHDGGFGVLEEAAEEPGVVTTKNEEPQGNQDEIHILLFHGGGLGRRATCK